MKLYLRNLTAANPPTSGEKSTALPSGTFQDQSSGRESLALRTTKGSSETSFTTATLAQTADQDVYHARFTSEALAAQTFGSGTWTFAFECLESATAANARFSASVYVWRPGTSAVVGYIVDFHETGGTSADEYPTTAGGKVYTSSGSNVTSQAGDVLVYELWTHHTQGNATARDITHYYDGTTDVTDGVDSGSAASYIDSPASITFQTGYSLNAEPGAFTVTGAAATLVPDRALNAGPGSFAVTGVAATLLSSAGYSLNAQPGVFSVVGATAGLSAPVQPARLITTSSTGTTSTLHTTGQAVTALARLYVSFDDMDVKPADRTWEDLSSYLRAWQMGGGRDSELDEHDAAACTLILDNRDRRFDPLNTASPWYGSLVPNRRVRLLVEADSASRAVFTGYVDGWGPTWESMGWGDGTATVTCSDGMKILAQAPFTAASPDVTEYDEVVQSDDPSFYYRMGEARGTKVVAHTRWVRYSIGGGKGATIRRRKRWRTTETRRPMTGVSGPAGTYKNTPLLGQEGPIDGDRNTAVLFRANQSEYAVVNDVDGEEALGYSDLTLSCWVNPVSWPASGERAGLIAGPWASATSQHVWSLVLRNDGTLRVNWLSHRLNTTSQTITSTLVVPTGSWSHVAVALTKPAPGWSGNATATFVVNGVSEERTTTWSASPDASSVTFDDKLYLARNRGENAAYLDGYQDEVAIYEEALTAARLQAHWEAAPLGFAANTTGGRIWDTLDLVGEWDDWNVQGGQRSMPVRRYAGVEPAALVAEAVDAEGTPAVFYFDPEGRPTFLDSAHRTATAYLAADFVFTSTGETL